MENISKRNKKEDKKTTQNEEVLKFINKATIDRIIEIVLLCNQECKISKTKSFPATMMLEKVLTYYFQNNTMSKKKGLDI